MSDYDPQSLASKWTMPLSDWNNKFQSNWNNLKPKRHWYNFSLPESDAYLDKITPRRDLNKLFDGRVVLGHFARAFFPAYIPGNVTHYGSVVYFEDTKNSDKIFELAWLVNELRNDIKTITSETEKIANAIQDDRSNFSRLVLPSILGAGHVGYFANICIQRNRLPVGYIHSRLIPILINPEYTEWCCILPLRYWDSDFVKIWSSGQPCYEPEPFISKCREYSIIP